MVTFENGPCKFSKCDNNITLNGGMKNGCSRICRKKQSGTIFLNLSSNKKEYQFNCTVYFQVQSTNITLPSSTNGVQMEYISLIGFATTHTCTQIVTLYTTYLLDTFQDVLIG